eukprot:4632370-Pyramimonas_sp.AAC.1
MACREGAYTWIRDQWASTPLLCQPLTPQLEDSRGLVRGAWVYSHDGPISRRKRRYILTMDQSDAGSA